MDKRNGGEKVSNGPCIFRVGDTAAPGSGAGSVMALRGGEKRERKSFRRAPAKEVLEPFRMMLVAPLITDDGVISFSDAGFGNGEILIPKCKVLVDGTRPAYHFLL